MDPAVGVLAAGLEQDHSRRGVFAEAGRDGAPGRTRAHHDEIGLDDLLPRGHLTAPRRPAKLSTVLDEGATTTPRTRRQYVIKFAVLGVYSVVNYAPNRRPPARGKLRSA